LKKIRDQQTRAESKTRLVEQIKIYLRSGDYSGALDLLRGTAAEFPNDAELSELEKLAQAGLDRNTEAQRLITASQELFSQQKSAEAIQLLREAYELDKNNSVARAILANALVEHAHSVVETDWLEAETLTNQALKLNPAHPTAKAIHTLIVDQKKNSSVEDWVARARKLQSSGDLFAALAWVAEGLAVHPDDPKLLQIHDSIQRDQGARRRQARRGDVEELRRIELAIDRSADGAAKQALAERIQGMAAKYWTDGEILSIANRLLQRLGIAQENSTAPQSKGAAIIFHVPRPSAPETSRANTPDPPPIQAPPIQATPNPVTEVPVQPQNVPPSTVPASTIAPSKLPPSEVPPSRVPPSKVRLRKAPPAIEPVRLAPTTPPQAPTVAAPAPSAAEAGVPSTSSQPKQVARSNSTTLILVCSTAVILLAATFVLTRKRYASPVAKTAPVPTTLPAPVVSAPAVPTAAQTTSADAVPAPAPANPEPSPPAPHASPDTGSEKAKVDNQPPAASAKNPRRQNLESQNLKSQNVQSQNLQPQSRLASLTIQGGAPGTTVLVDQTLVGTVQPDGTLSVSTINPGDHSVELRNEKFKPRQFKKHFIEGGTISLTAADAVLEAASGELKITFTPADAKVAIAKGEILKTVSSGVSLDLAAGTYTLTARTAEKFTRSSTLEVITGQSKTLDLSLAPNGMSKWDDPGAWKHEGDTFIHKGGDFVLFGVAPASGTFVFSAMPAKGRLLQWVLNYSDPKNYVLFQLDDNNFYRTVIRDGQKIEELKVPDKGDKKSFRTLQIRVSQTELVHQIKHGDSWSVVDRWTQPGANLGQGKFGFYIPGSDQVVVSSFAHYADLNVR
jgi:Flp pilus assembly protein TadD